MKRLAICIAAISAPVLAGCAEDDPANPPLLGRWELTRTIDSVSVDGMIFATDQLPAEMRAFEGVQTWCLEPLYTDAEWQADDVVARTNGACSLDSYDHTTRTATYGGSCSMSEDGGTYTPSLSGRSTFSADRIRDVITMEGTITVPGDTSPHVMRVIVVQEGARLGDC